MKFWDSSALVPILAEEQSSRACRNLLRADPTVFAWTFAAFEVWGACCRKRRERTLDGEELDRIRLRLDRLAEGWFDVGDSAALRAQAKRILRERDLKAADALQLAAAIVWAKGLPRQFVACDQRLIAAARSEGLTTIRPE